MILLAEVQSQLSSINKEIILNLSQDKLVRLNNLLKNTNIDLPEFRRKVSSSGNNYVWLQKHILIKNPNISQALKDLLSI